MKKLIIVFIIALAFLAISFLMRGKQSNTGIAPCASRNENPEMRYFGGRVVNYSTAEPIGGFEVSLFEENGAQVIRGRTDAAGEFRFCGLAAKDKDWRVSLAADRREASGRAVSIYLPQDASDSYSILLKVRPKPVASQ